MTIIDSGGSSFDNKNFDSGTFYSAWCVNMI